MLKLASGSKNLRKTSTSLEGALVCWAWQGFNRSSCAPTVTITKAWMNMMAVSWREMLNYELGILNHTTLNLSFIIHNYLGKPTLSNISSII